MQDCQGRCLRLLGCFGSGLRRGRNLRAPGRPLGRWRPEALAHTVSLGRSTHFLYARERRLDCLYMDGHSGVGLHRLQGLLQLLGEHRLLKLQLRQHRVRRGHEPAGA